MLDDEGYCMECGEYMGAGSQCDDCDHDDDGPICEPGDDYLAHRLEGVYGNGAGPEHDEEG